MSSQFLGLTMLVTMSNPVGAQLRGEVSSIDPGKSLTLRNVVCPANGKTVPEFTISAAEIVELVEAPKETIASPRLPSPAPVTFADPAILSMGRRPSSMFTEKQAVPLHTDYNAAPLSRGHSAQTLRDERALKDITPVSSLVEPMSSLQTTLLEMGDADAVVFSELEAKAEVSPIQATTAQRKKRSRKKGQLRRNVEDITEPDVVPAKETMRSKGWRQTPLLEPNPSFQPFTTLNRRKGRAAGRMEDSGWATEDATDVQDLGDFDFQGSLAKFDKRTVFHQIQAEDVIPDSDRLVAHNRLPQAKPGTAGGKNLHFTEMVLDSPSAMHKKPGRWKSEAGETDIEEQVDHKDTGTASGRHSTKEDRNDSRLSSMKQSASRKGSSTALPPSRSQSIPASVRASFYLVPSDRRCEPVSALQMLNLENIADHDLGLTEDMMTENAGRGVAEVAFSALNANGRGLIHKSTVVASTVAVLVGNNKSGARALAAGRHLRNHGINVVVCLLGLEHESDLIASLRRQLRVFRGCAGKVLGRAEFLNHVRIVDNVVSLIVDGLLGLSISFEELRLGDQATAYELMEWANRSPSCVLAIDIPTGIDPANGKISVIDGRPLYMHARYVVAMGAPQKGLLEAMTRGYGVSGEDVDNTAIDDGDGDINGYGPDTVHEWQLFVADLGLGAAVWKKAGTRVRRGAEFDGRWVLGMRFQNGVL